MSSLGQGRPTSPQELLPLLISKAARSNPTRRALIAQIANGPLTQQQLQLEHNKESITRTVVQRVKEHINRLLGDKGLEDIITVSTELTSLDLLLELAHFIENSGEWAGWKPIVRVARHKERVERLPIELVSADVEGVGSREVFDSRCEALRQLSIIGRHLGMTLERPSERRNIGEERLDGHRLTIRPLENLPARHAFRDGFDPANPVCEYRGDDFASICDAVLNWIRFGGSEVASHFVFQYNDPAGYARVRDLANQQPPVWNCRTISTSHQAAGFSLRVIVLHGDQPKHMFQAHIDIYSNPHNTQARLYTTEPPVVGVGAGRFPQTVGAARQVMGAGDAQLVFGGLLVP